ncbi:tRNA (adenosine(37)-N6)-threonylcarbamoyltransferase complex dimerization subunit type 1 TsaB [Ottowia sp.]|uniref:tRNA (adenosine(37)-N6)-threonylcarbamoyltransferase complex dimerization subunit type 1 TsaB n=1 Tax=Ottowia sp. TaxID=1898956 RepID=UPI003A885F5B
MSALANLLAFDTSTEQMSVAVQRADGQRWAHCGPGGAQASSTLIPAVLRLLGQAGLALPDLHAVVFGRGPGSFTGLRTACSVAQGLAFGTTQPDGASVPVLPVDTLLAVAECARQRHGVQRVLALLDARMSEVYSAPYVYDDGAQSWQMHAHADIPGDLSVGPPEALTLPAGAAPDGWALAGNAFAGEYLQRLPAALQALPRWPALPEATALLDLAPALLAAGRAVSAEQALPLYIRDKVAQTTAERAAHAARAAQTGVR